MPGKKSQLEQAIQSVEEDIAMLEQVLERLKHQRKEKASSRKLKPVKAAIPPHVILKAEA
jgi:predicted DNA-binding protein